MEESPIVDQRNVRTRFDNFSQRDAVDEPMSAFDPWNVPQGGQYRKGDSSSASPPAVSPLQPPENTGPWKAPHLAIAPPQTDGGPTTSPTLIGVHNKRGPPTGDEIVWLTGNNFPAHFPLYARFGTSVARTVSLRDARCKPQLTTFLRPSPVAVFFPVVFPPQACPVWSMLRYRSTPSQMRRSMEPVSRSFDT